MTKDKHKTKVIFRKWRYNGTNDDIIAIFPELKEGVYACLSYMHIGQHGKCSPDHIINGSKLATPEEYKGLYNELTSIGYNLRVMKRRSN